MTDPRKLRGPITLFLSHSGVRSFVVIMTGVLVLYVASFGPVCRCLPRDKETCRTLAEVYYPLTSFFIWCQSVPMERALRWYGGETGAVVYSYANWEAVVLSGGDPPDVNILFPRAAPSPADSSDR